MKSEDNEINNKKINNKNYQLLNYLKILLKGVAKLHVQSARKNKITIN